MFSTGSNNINMEKAVLKTLIYADIFDYPLTVFEIHKWLIGRKANLRQVESALGRLVKSSKLKVQNGHYFLSGRESLPLKRLRRERQSKEYLKKAQLIAQFLKIIPTIKLVGISGGLALNNTSKTDDIDLFVITSKKRLWISRLLILSLLSLTGQRRKAIYSKRQAAGKLCLNTILEEDCLEQSNKDIYLAHEVLQMKALWQRNDISSKYLLDNDWVFKFLPNWISDARLTIKDLRLTRKNYKSKIINHKSLFDYVENLAKWWQLKIMQQPKGMERIAEGALYFHPKDYRLTVLQEYNLQLKKL